MIGCVTPGERGTALASGSSSGGCLAGVFSCCTSSTGSFVLNYRIVCLNSFKLNGISHSYHFDQSISILRVVGWYFFFSKSTFLKNSFRNTIKVSHFGCRSGPTFYRD